MSVAAHAAIWVIHFTLPVQATPRTRLRSSEARSSGRSARGSASPRRRGRPIWSPFSDSPREPVGAAWSGIGCEREGSVTSFLEVSRRRRRRSRVVCSRIRWSYRGRGSTAGAPICTACAGAWCRHVGSRTRDADPCCGAATHNVHRRPSRVTPSQAPGSGRYRTPRCHPRQTPDRRFESGCSSTRTNNRPGSWPPSMTSRSRRSQRSRWS